MPLVNEVKIPAVKKVQLVIDDAFIRKCLRKRKISDIKDVRWPEALKAIYRATERAENELLHIESVCRKAREEQISPYKNKLWEIINKFSMIKEMDREAEERNIMAIQEANKCLSESSNKIDMIRKKYFKA